MRAHMLAAVVAAALLVCAGFGWAQGWDGTDIWTADDAAAMPLPSWFGSTGLIVVPSAEVIAPEVIQAHIATVETPNDDWAVIGGLNVSVYEGLEAGVTFLDDTWTGGDSETLVQAKYQIPLQSFLELGPEVPMLAVGGTDLGDQINRTWYVAASKDLPLTTSGDRVATVTVGFGDTEVDDTPLDGFFAGVEMPLFDFGQIQLEHDGENFNGALRYWWSDWAVTEFAVLDDDMGFGFTVNSGF